MIIVIHDLNTMSTIFTLSSAALESGTAYNEINVMIFAQKDVSLS
jgi:hypothetical protein